MKLAKVAVLLTLASAPVWAQVNAGEQEPEDSLPFTMTTTATFGLPWRVAFLPWRITGSAPFLGLAVLARMLRCAISFILFVQVIGTFRRQDPIAGNLWVPRPWRVKKVSPMGW